MSRIDHAAQAERIRAAANHLADRVRADTSLSPAVKSARIGRIQIDCNAYVKALDDAASDRDGSQSNGLRNALFGYGSDPTSVIIGRDATQRAAALNPMDEAVGLAEMKAARQMNDSVMEKAIAATAVSNGWRSVVADYSAAHPDLSDRLSDLTAVEWNKAGDGLKRVAVMAPVQYPEVTDRFGGVHYSITDAASKLPPVTDQLEHTAETIRLMSAQDQQTAS